MGKIQELQSLMAAFVTDGRMSNQPEEYRRLYSKVLLDLEELKYANPNPHKSLEVFWSFCKLQNMETYASRRSYIQDLYADVLLDLERAQRHGGTSKDWKRANDVLSDNLAPVRSQWLKAKNFIYSSNPDFENSVKESINCVESCLKILLKEPAGTLGKIIRSAKLDVDIERLISQAYGIASNKDSVRHGGTGHSKLTKLEAEFFLEFSASSIIYIVARCRDPGAAV